MNHRRALCLVLVVALLAPMASSAAFRDQASAATTANAGAASLAIAKPATVASGDLMLAFVLVGSSSSTVTGPSTANAWTALTSASATSVSLRQFVFYRMATATEDASFTFTINPAARAVGAVVAYAGVEPTNHFGTVSTSLGPATSTTITAPAATTTVSDEVLVAAFGLLRATPSIADPTPVNAGAPALTPRSPATGTLASTGGAPSSAHVGLRVLDTIAATVGVQSAYEATLTSAGANIGTIIGLKATPDLTVGADPVGADGVVQTGMSWGAWSAAPGAANVPSLNYLKITNTGTTATQRFVVSFSSGTFTGVSTPAETIPLNNNIQFAVCEDATPGTSSPSECSFVYGGTSGNGSVTDFFDAVGNIVYVAYRLVLIPDPTVDQVYQASFTVTEA